MLGSGSIHTKAGAAAFALVLAIAALGPSAMAHGCLDSLTATKGWDHPLPATCRQVGPIRLGMPYAQVRRLLGPYDAIRHHDGGFTVAYMYPRNFHGYARYHFIVASAPTSSQPGMLYVTIERGRVTAVGAFSGNTAAVPYGMPGLMPGDSDWPLLRSQADRYTTDRWRDEIRLDYYPMIVDVNRNDNRITGVQIATDERSLGNAPGGMPEFVSKFNRAGQIIGFDIKIN